MGNDIKYANAGCSISSPLQLAPETLGCRSYCDAVAHKGDVNILGELRSQHG